LRRKTELGSPADPRLVHLPNVEVMRAATWAGGMTRLPSDGPMAARGLKMIAREMGGPCEAAWRGENWRCYGCARVDQAERPSMGIPP
jgi:hypothetical protein